MDILNKTIEIIELYDVYQDLLTEKQRTYIEAYYFDDYSLSEIAENLKVSRNAVFDLIKRTVQKMYEYEKKLMLRVKNQKRNIIFKQIEDESDQKKIRILIEELQKVE